MRRTGSKTLAQKASLLFGLTFLAVGVAGFIPGLTTDYDRLGVYDEPGAKLLGIFAVNWLHNIVHLLFGVAGLAMAKTHASARKFLIGGGIIYLALWIYGMVIDLDSSANFVASNTADNWLHLFLGSALLITGLATRREAAVSSYERDSMSTMQHRRAG